jgi:hypothetical protein
MNARSVARIRFITTMLTGLIFAETPSAITYRKYGIRKGYDLEEITNG